MTESSDTPFNTVLSGPPHDRMETLRLDAGDPFVWRVGDATVITTLRVNDQSDHVQVTLRIQLDSQADDPAAIARRTATLALRPWHINWDTGDPLPEPITTEHLSALLTQHQDALLARADSMLLARNRELWTEQDMSGYQPRALVRYRTLFPADFDLVPSHDGKAYFLEDYYCLEHNCPCTTVAFTVTAVADDAEGESQELGNATIELMVPKLSPTGSKAAVSVVQKVMQDPLMQKRVAQRFAECRRIAPAFAAKLGRIPSPVLRAAKVGRNDPCPCGSGKKYKKCCINKPAAG